MEAVGADQAGTFSRGQHMVGGTAHRYRWDEAVHAEYILKPCPCPPTHPYGSVGAGSRHPSVLLCLLAPARCSLHQPVSNLEG